MSDACSYQERIFARYATARATPLAPTSLEGLQPRFPYLRRLVRRHFPRDRGAAIFELGCGHGAFLHVLHCEGYTNVRGVDGSPEQITAAQRLGIDGVSLGDVMEALMQIPDGSLDLLIAFDLIEHFTKDELLRLVDEAHRVLRPDGRWIVHVPNGESPFGGRMRYGDFTHELAFTRESLAQLLMSSSFSKVRCFEDKPVPHGAKSFIRAVLWALIRSGLLLAIAVETGAFDRKAVFSQNLLAVAWRSC